jgi:hypothetical protein
MEFLISGGFMSFYPSIIGGCRLGGIDLVKAFMFVPLQQKLKGNE